MIIDSSPHTKLNPGDIREHLDCSVSDKRSDQHEWLVELDKPSGQNQDRFGVGSINESLESIAYKEYVKLFT